VVQERIKLEAAPPVGCGSGGCPAGDQQAHAFAAHTLGQLEAHPQRPDRDQLMHRLAPRAGTGQVDQVEDGPARLAVEMTVDEARTFHRQGQPVFGGPTQEVCQQIAVARQIVRTKATVEVRRQKRNAAASICGSDNQTGDIGFKVVQAGACRRTGARTTLSRVLLSLSLLAVPGASPASGAQEKTAAASVPEFFPLDNGVGRGAWTPTQQATCVQELGFDGIGYNYTKPEDLAAWLKALSPRGLKLYSLYFGITLDRGDYDVFGMLVALQRAGYRGPIGLQCYSIKGDPKENLRKSMGAWRGYMTRLGAQQTTK